MLDASQRVLRRHFGNFIAFRLELLCYRVQLREFYLKEGILFIACVFQKRIQKPLRKTSLKYLCTYVYNAVLRGITCNLCNSYIFKDCKAQNERDRYNPSFLKCIEQICVIANYMLNNRNINEQAISNITNYINNYVKVSFKCQHAEKIEETLIKTITILCTTHFVKKLII